MTSVGREACRRPTAVELALSCPRGSAGGERLGDLRAAAAAAGVDHLFGPAVLVEVEATAILD
ncbi:hypothetical protein [Micromonospora sp. NBC_00421]|uniref:hypothetical protein n=1 Tax=Micromonospora sp. NBC_00421 TaxID=2975976 RepID=UPI002E227065